MATGLAGGKTGSRPGRPRQAPRAQPPRPRRPPRPQPEPAAQPERAGQAQRARPAAGPQARPRTPFVLLLIGLLGGGLVCLLLLNTTLAQGAFQISAMQQQNTTLSQQEQALAQQTTAEEAPASIAARAEQLGMRPVGRLSFINLKTGRIYRQPATVPGVIPQPGYTP